MSHVAPPTIQANLRTIADLIKDVRVAMLMTKPLATDPDHGLMPLRARPMYTQRINPTGFTGELWFFTDENTGKIAEIEACPQIMLTYALPDRNTFVVVHGDAACEHNEEKARELWNIHARGWWPEGPASESLRLIRVHMHHAEYWQGPSNTSYMLSLLKAVAQGRRVELDAEHGVADSEDSPHAATHGSRNAE